mgnify:CR=1 FL=1
MKDSTMTSEVTLPYAKALMDIAKENGVVDHVGNEVAALLAVLNESAELNQFLGNPLIEPEAKKGALPLARKRAHPGVFGQR